jgi:hypothetical protein
MRTKRNVITAIIRAEALEKWPQASFVGLLVHAALGFHVSLASLAQESHLAFEIRTPLAHGQVHFQMHFL